MGANPMREKSSAYDSLSVNERLAFGRLGLGKAQIRTASDVKRARKMISETQRLKNRLPNPTQAGLQVEPRPAVDLDSTDAEKARSLREGFEGTASEHYTVQDEPHVPSGDYTDCGEFIAVAVKPTSSGETSAVQEIVFPGKDLELICDPDGRQLYIVGVGQVLEDRDVRIFSADTSQRVCLGECRVISYGMVKFGAEVPVSARGEDVRWDHQFGEEGGTCPKIYYDRKFRRLILGRATYRIEGAWIRN